MPKTPKRRSAQGSAAIGIIGGVGFLVLGGLILVPISRGGSQSKDAGATTSPTPHAELAIVEAASTAGLASESTVQLALRVRNAAADRETYRWTVATQPPGRAAATGRLTLAAGVPRILHLRIPVRCTAPGVRVSVSLDGTPQAITVWVPCTSHGAPPPPPSTELTFVNPRAPGTRQANGTVKFAVTVDNDSGKSHRYLYMATAKLPGQAPVVAATGSFTMADAHFAVVRLQVPVICTRGRARISATVDSTSTGGTRQVIGFWEPCTSGHT